MSIGETGSTKSRVILLPSLKCEPTPFIETKVDTQAHVRGWINDGGSFFNRGTIVIISLDYKEDFASLV